MLIECCVANLSAQSTRLQRAVAVVDTFYFEQLDSLIRDVYWTKQPDSALHYAVQLFELANQNKEEEYASLALERKAILYKRLGDYRAAIPVNEARIEFCELARYDKIKRYQDLSSAHKELAYALRKVGQTRRSLEHYQHSIRYAEAIGEDGKKQLAIALNSLGSLYLNTRTYEQAKEKYKSSLEIAQAINYTQGIYSVLNNLGLVHARNGDYETAITYYGRSLEMKKKAGDKKRMANTYGSIGDIYLAWGKETEAHQYFLQAKAIQEELGLRDELTRSLTQLGDLALLQNKPQEALEWCSKSYAIAEEDQLWQASMACNQCLYKAFKTLGRTEEALQYYEAYIAVRDSVINKENSLEIERLETQYEYEQQLTAAEKEQAVLTSEAKQERLLRWFFLGSTLAFGLISWLTFRNSRLRRRQNETLVAKNQQISEDHELIQAQAKQLQETALMKDRFFTNVSHELRTPLTLVSSPLGKILDEDMAQLPPSVQTDLKLVKGNSDKLLDLVEELLELSQLEAGAVNLYEQNLMVVPFVQQLYANYELAAKEKSIDYRFNSRLPIDFQIKTDLKRLGKIVDNLLSNAFKFTPEKGQIKLGIDQLEEETPLLRIRVKDTGAGIKETEILHFLLPGYPDSSDQTNGV
ncbi:MAG: tetratricopeptide repeat-containing sensor histidine kinase, partial [Bacteroidota bacterium]